MTGMEVYLYWIIACGIALNIWMVWKLGGVSGRILYAAAAAASFTRFCLACGKVHGFRKQKHPSWIYAPMVWWTFFSVEVISGKLGPIKHLGGSGEWRGIGQWTVFPKKESDSCE